MKYILVIWFVFLVSCTNVTSVSSPEPGWDPNYYTNDCLVLYENYPNNRKLTNDGGLSICEKGRFSNIGYNIDYNYYYMPVYGGIISNTNYYCVINNNELVNIVYNGLWQTNILTNISAGSLYFAGINLETAKPALPATNRFIDLFNGYFYIITEVIAFDYNGEINSGVYRHLIYSLSNGLERIIETVGDPNPCILGRYSGPSGRIALGTGSNVLLAFIDSNRLFIERYPQSPVFKTNSYQTGVTSLDESMPFYTFLYGFTTDGKYLMYSGLADVINFFQPPWGSYRFYYESKSETGIYAQPYLYDVQGFTNIKFITNDFQDRFVATTAPGLYYMGSRERLYGFNADFTKMYLIIEANTNISKNSPLILHSGRNKFNERGIWEVDITVLGLVP